MSTASPATYAPPLPLPRAAAAPAAMPTSVTRGGATISIRCTALWSTLRLGEKPPRSVDVTSAYVEPPMSKTRMAAGWLSSSNPAVTPRRAYPAGAIEPSS